jgi:2-polyprenyl-3-methyl-5-hydroxy-6-metoxy-1,4-benzoquinol methylase
MNDSSEKYQKELYLAYDGPYQGKKTSSILLPIIKRFVCEPILDVGAGDGALIVQLRNLGFQAVEGIDLAPAADFIREGSVTCLPFNDDSFRTVFCAEVIEHLQTDQSVDGLSEILRVLRPGGRVIVTVPDREVMARNHVVCPYCSQGFHRYGHHQVFDNQKISELLTECGFKVRSVKSYALGAMAVVPMGRLLNFVFRRLNFESVAVTLVAVAEKPS